MKKTKVIQEERGKSRNEQGRAPMCIWLSCLIILICTSLGGALMFVACANLFILDLIHNAHACLLVQCLLKIFL